MRGPKASGQKRGKRSGTGEDSAATHVSQWPVVAASPLSSDLNDMNAGYMMPICADAACQHRGWQKESRESGRHTLDGGSLGG